MAKLQIKSISSEVLCRIHYLNPKAANCDHQNKAWGVEWNKSISPTVSMQDLQLWRGLRACRCPQYGHGHSSVCGQEKTINGLHPSNYYRGNTIELLYEATPGGKCFTIWSLCLWPDEPSPVIFAFYLISFHKWVNMCCRLRLCQPRVVFVCLCLPGCRNDSCYLKDVWAPAEFCLN